MNDSITLKRVFKYSISKEHELFYFCEEETFYAKNLKNLANYYLRQCFSLHSRDISTLSDEQKELIMDVNKAITNFNEKSKALFSCERADRKKTRKPFNASKKRCFKKSRVENCRRQKNASLFRRKA